MSRTYQMSSRPDRRVKLDPNNDLLWRFDMRRLAAEEIRDSILNLTGQLNLKMGGPSIYTEIPAEWLVQPRVLVRPGDTFKETPPDAACISL